MFSSIEWMQVVQALSAVVTGIMAVLLYATTKKINKFSENFNTRKAEEERKAEIHHFFHNYIELLNHMNSVVVSDDRNLKIVKEYGEPDPEDKMLLARKEWITFMWLNILEMAFLGKKDGLLYNDYAEITLDQLIPILMRDQTAYRLVVNRAYHPDFVEYCKKEYKKLNCKP